jgi:hypothetical protein
LRRHARAEVIELNGGGGLTSVCRRHGMGVLRGGRCLDAMPELKEGVTLNGGG